MFSTPRYVRSFSLLLELPQDVMSIPHHSELSIVFFDKLLRLDVRMFLVGLHG